MLNSALNNYKISIIGAGNWGTTLAVILSRDKGNVFLFSVFPKENISMQKYRENKYFLKGIKFPPSLQVLFSWGDVFKSDIIVIAVPVTHIRSVLRKIKKSKVNFKNKIFVSVSKGIEVKSLKRVSEIVKDELGNVRFAVLSGPTIAHEVVRYVPTTAVVSSRNKKILPLLQSIFTTETFRVYTHSDIVGVELGGALKNIIAIACGIADGLGFGTNTKAALVTRGLVEIIRLGKIFGAVDSTFWGISGLGDLVTTCFSPFSRNRFVGEQIGKGKKLCDVLKKMNMVAEGVETVKSAYLLSKRYNIDMPITREVYFILYRNKSPIRAVKDLMSRPLKEEYRSVRHV